jgi:hypothetical protein
VATLKLYFQPGGCGFDPLETDRKLGMNPRIRFGCCSSSGIGFPLRSRGVSAAGVLRTTAGGSAGELSADSVLSVRSAASTEADPNSSNAETREVNAFDIGIDAACAPIATLAASSTVKQRKIITLFAEGWTLRKNAAAHDSWTGINEDGVTGWAAESTKINGANSGPELPRTG